MEHIVNLARVLADNKVRFVFGVVGSGASIQLISELEEKQVSYYPVAHEAAAVMMAGACSRDGICRAAAVGIKGPGFANFLPGIILNSYENRPALTISEAYGPNTPLLKHKRLDHKNLAAPIIKAFATADGKDESLISLLSFAEEEIPGPVHLDLCNYPVAYIQKEEKKNSTSLNKNELEHVLGLIEKSRRPAILLGSMVSRRLSHIDWGKIGVPVLTTAAAKGCVDEFSPYAGGVVTGEIKEYSPETAVLEHADLIIAFGLRDIEVVQAKPLCCPLIIIDTVNVNLNEGFGPLVVYTSPDIDATASGVVHAVSGKNWGSNIIREYIAKLENEVFRDKWLPARAFRSLQNTISNAVLVLDTGLFCTVGEIVWKARTPSDFCGSSNSRFMGTSVPTAIGVAVSNPSRKVVCVAGDGGIRPYLQEIKLAVEENLSILFILMSDGYYGTVASSSLPKGFSKRAVKITSPGWWRAIEAMGCNAYIVAGEYEFEKLIKTWDVRGGPLFIEMNFEPERYFMMTEKLR